MRRRREEEKGGGEGRRRGEEEREGGEGRRRGEEERRGREERKRGEEEREGGEGRRKEGESMMISATKSCTTSSPSPPPPSPCVSAQTSTWGKVAQTARRSRYSSSESLRTRSRRSVSFIAANCSMVMMLRWRKGES